MTPNVRFYQGRVSIPGDHGIIHFLLREDAGRSLEQSSVDLLRAGFLSLQFDSPLCEFVNRAELKEISETDFNFRKGTFLGSGHIHGMEFWWMR